MQKLIDEAWHGEVERIYGTYTHYRQSNGAEQPIFTMEGTQVRRSLLVFRHMLERAPISDRGRMLDIGAGNGAGLETFASLRPDWSLNALDLDEQNLQSLGQISGFESLFTCSIEDVPGQFDLISAIHSLEHLVEPTDMLAGVRGKLAPAGKLVVQVPYYRANPFDLVIADHRSHFSPETLGAMLCEEGVAPELISTELLPKEISVVAGIRQGDCRGLEPGFAAKELAVVEARVAWLHSLITEAREAAASGRPFGIFGTSIGATWLYGAMPSAVAFFVDEDRSRAGGTWQGLPIHLPEDTPTGAVVYAVMPDFIARDVAERMAGHPFEVAIPRAMDAA